MAARVTDVAILLMLVTGCCCVGRNHRGPAVINNKQPRVPSGNRLGQSRFTCANLLAMFRRSRQLGRVINKSIGDILNTKVRNFESNLKLKVLELYRREVNASEGAVITAMAGFNRTLSSDYTSLTKIMDSCESRLQEMQSAALLVEQNHNSLHKLEKETAALLESRNQSRTEHHSLLNEFLLEISRAADVLEGTLTDNAFSNLVEEKGVDIETVVKVGGGKTHHKKPPESADSLEDEESSSNEVVIIDSSNNRYTLSRPHDITVLVEDPHLIHDIVTLLLVSCVLGLLCSLMGMPLLFGYGVAGMLLGPGGFNIIKVCCVHLIDDRKLFESGSLAQ